MESKKKKHHNINEPIYKTEIVTEIEKTKKIWLPRVKGEGPDNLVDWDWHMDTTIYKIEN